MSKEYEDVSYDERAPNQKKIASETYNASTSDGPDAADISNRKKLVGRIGKNRKPIGNVGIKRKRDKLEASDKKKKTALNNSKVDARRSIKQKKAHVQREVPILNVRSSPQPLNSVLKTLNDAQREAIKQMGFAGILSLSLGRIPSKLAYWLIDNFDEKTCELRLQNASLTITKEAVHKMLGLPIGGLPIKAAKTVVTKNDKVIQEWRSDFGKKKDNISITDIKKKIKGTEDAGRMFKLHFLVLFATTMAERPCHAVSSPRFLPSIENDHVIKNLDWCGYIMDCLKTSKAGRNRSAYSGPLTLLTLFYIDSTMCQSIQVSRKRPAIKGWTTKLLKGREKAELKLGGFGKGAIEPPLEVEEFEDDGTEIPGTGRDITPKWRGQEDKEVDNGDDVQNVEDLEHAQSQELQHNGNSCEESRGEPDTKINDMNEVEENHGDMDAEANDMNEVEQNHGELDTENNDMNEVEENHGELNSEKNDMNEVEENHGELNSERNDIAAAEVNNLQGYIVDIESAIKKINDNKTALEGILSQAFGEFPDSVELHNLKLQVEAMFRRSSDEHQAVIIISDSEEEVDPFYKYVYGSKK